MSDNKIFKNNIRYRNSYEIKAEFKPVCLDSQVGQLYEEGQKKPRSGIKNITV